MSKILTITFNPAIDKSTSVDNLISEKKLKCTNPKFEPGGGGINVARAIKRLGGESTALYLAGGYTGNYFTELLVKENIQTIAVSCKNHTRENLIVFDEKSKLQYRFGMPGPVINESEWKDVLNTIEKINDIEFIVASGSISEGVPIDIFGRISRIAKLKKIKLIVDSSGDALKESVDEGLFMLKPNINELSFLNGAGELRTEDVEDAAKSIISRGKCKFMVISMGAEGAMLITEESTFKITPPKVNSISTVGAGDSMVAGIVQSLSLGRSITESVKYGVSCGTAATMNSGTELCHMNDVEKIYSQITIK